MRNKNLRLFMLIALIFFQLIFVIGQIGAAPPLPIGDSGYLQGNPYESNPTAHTSSGVSAPAPTNAYDGVLSTNTNFFYGVDGYFEVKTFDNSPSPTFAIGWVDLKITCKSLSSAVNDDKYRIVYYVDPNTTAIVLQDWVTANAAVFPYGASSGSLPANRPWSNITEPNDGVWDWTDINNLRVRVETQLVNTNGFQKFYLNEVWLSVYSTQLPQNGLTLQPTVIKDLHVDDYFFCDVYIYNGSNPISNLWGYQFQINYNTTILTAVDYFSYHPFNAVLGSEINDTLGQVTISYTSYGGDPVGLTTNSPLTRIYFKVDADGRSVLHFSMAILPDARSGRGLSPDVNDGVFSTSPLHDIAAVDMKANTTIVMPGSEATVKVTIMNQGTFNETSVGVTALYDTTPFANQILASLGSGITTRLTFTWNTTGVPLGFRQMKASVAVSSDQDPSNDVFIDDYVLAGHHDISVSTVTRISPSNVTIPEGTTLKVERGEIAYVNVTISNVGNFTETNINVTAKWKEKNLSIGNVTGISLDAGASTTATFRWNTTVGWNFPTDRFGRPLNWSDGHVEGIASVVPFEKGVDYDLSGNNDLVGGLVNVTRPLLSPFAAFNFGPKPNAYVGQPVRFDASPPGYSRTPNGTKIVSYRWDFGDGNVTTVPNSIISHVYKINGKFQITLMVANNLSLTDATSPSQESQVTVLRRNLLVLEMVPNATSVLTGSTVAINVSIMNRGDDFEQFNVTAYYGSAIIGKLNGTQTGGDLGNWTSRTLHFDWNSSGVTVGTYVIKAVIDTLDWESNTTDNTFVYGTISVLWHNIAITEVATHPTQVTVGEKVSINVTVVNQGNFTETFIVTVRSNDTEIGTQTVSSLVAGASEALSFNWDTTGASVGSYTIKVAASTVSGETKTIDNTFIGSVVTVEAAPGLDIMTYAVVGIAGVVVIALVLLYFFKIRKPK